MLSQTPLLTISDTVIYHQSTDPIIRVHLLTFAALKNSNYVQQADQNKRAAQPGANRTGSNRNGMG
jgi:hypothetical protein